jgi:hypothetical protein
LFAGPFCVPEVTDGNLYCILAQYLSLELKLFDNVGMIHMIAWQDRWLRIWILPLFWTWPGTSVEILLLDIFYSGCISERSPASAYIFENKPFPTYLKQTKNHFK